MGCEGEGEPADGTAAPLQHSQPRTAQLRAAAPCKRRPFHARCTQPARCAHPLREALQGLPLLLVREGGHVGVHVVVWPAQRHAVGRARDGARHHLHRHLGGAVRVPHRLAARQRVVHAVGQLRAERLAAGEEAADAEARAQRLEVAHVLGGQRGDHLQEGVEKEGEGWRPGQETAGNGLRFFRAAVRTASAAEGRAAAGKQQRRPARPPTSRMVMRCSRHRLAMYAGSAAAVERTKGG